MTPRVSCDDCSWSDDADDLLEASDLAEEHEAKEQHRVSIDRVAADGGHVPEDELADEIEAEICSRIWDRDDRTLFFKSSNLAEDLDMPVERFNVGLRTLRKREDSRLDIERWNGETCSSPWEATLTKQVAADGGRAPGGGAAPPQTPLDGQQRCPTCEGICSGDDDYCSHCGTRLQDVPLALEFADEYIPAIIRGDKDATVRYPPDGHEIETGDRVRLVTDADDPFGRVSIRRTASVSAVEALSFLELVGAEYPTDDVDELIAGVSQHYDDAIRPGTTVRVICWTDLSYDGEVVPDV